MFEVILFNAKQVVLSREKVRDPDEVKSTAFGLYDKARGMGFHKLSLGLYANGKLVEMCTSRVQLARLEVPK